MAKGNWKSNEELDPLDIDHELPAGDGQPGDEPGAPQDSAAAELELQKLRAESAAYLDRLARLQAEFDNFRKRSLREQQEYREYALAEALKQLLPILDSLDRALKTGNATASEFHSGIELIDRQFHDALAKLGLEPVPAKGAAFDPNLHQAVQMVPSTAVPENHVAEELQRGYKLHERLLRPAMVLVAHNPKK